MEVKIKLERLSYLQAGMSAWQIYVQYLEGKMERAGRPFIGGERKANEKFNNLVNTLRHKQWFKIKFYSQELVILETTEVKEKIV